MAGQESSVFGSIYRPVAVCCRPAGEVRREPAPRASTHVLLWAAGVLPVTDGLFLQEPRHLQLLADLEDCSVFSLLSGKKQYSAPTDFGLCLKVRSPPSPPCTLPANVHIPLEPLEFKQCILLSAAAFFLNRNIVSHWMYSFT